MVDYVKFSDWVVADLLPLPANQTLPDDKLVVIRAGVPYKYDPVIRFAYANMVANASATSIGVVDQWESIAGTLVASGIEQGLSLAANVFTVTAATSLWPIKIRAGVSIMKVGGGTAVNFEIGIFVNGLLVGAPQVGLASSAQWGNMNVSVPTILANGDTVEIKIRNRTDADDVVVSDMSFGIG